MVNKNSVPITLSLFFFIWLRYGSNQNIYDPDPPPNTGSNQNIYDPDPPPNTGSATLFSTVVYYFVEQLNLIESQVPEILKILQTLICVLGENIF